MATRREFIKDTAAVAGLVFTGCGVLDAAPALAQPKPSGKRREVTVGGRRVKVIDVHAHCVIPEALALAGRKVGDFRGPGIDEVGARRIAEMDEQGIDVEALSINPYWYRLERDVVTPVIKLQNEKLAEFCATHPDRFVAYASLALQFPDLAVQQLVEGVKKLGLRGAAIGGSVGGVDFSDPKFSRCGPKPRSWASCCSSIRKARRSSPGASRATAGCRIPSATRSIPRSRSRT